MSHENIKFHILRTTSNVDGVSIYDVLPECFGKQDGMSQDGLSCALNCASMVDDWSHHVSEVPKLSEYIFDTSDIPSYLSIGCEDMSYSAIRVITDDRGVGKFYELSTD